MKLIRPLSFHNCGDPYERIHTMNMVFILYLFYRIMPTLLKYGKWQGWLYLVIFSFILLHNAIPHHHNDCADIQGSCMVAPADECSISSEEGASCFLHVLKKFLNYSHPEELDKEVSHLYHSTDFPAEFASEKDKESDVQPGPMPVKGLSLSNFLLDSPSGSYLDRATYPLKDPDLRPFSLRGPPVA